MKGKKTGGRKKGTPNRTTAEAKEFLEKIIFGQFDAIPDVLATLKEEDKAKYIDSLHKLIQYVLPKKSDLTSKDNALNPLTIVNDKDSGDI